MTRHTYCTQGSEKIKGRALSLSPFLSFSLCLSLSQLYWGYYGHRLMNLYALHTLALIEVHPLCAAAPLKGDSLPLIDRERP